VASYEESIHGKGLLESGLTVSASCVDCHTAHRELPSDDHRSSVNPANVAETCAQCHRGIYRLFRRSIHDPRVTNTDKKLPTCNGCHTAHQIARTDVDTFRMGIMNQCGRCHEKVMEGYFQTYHGKAADLGYGKSAKCYDCHGAHDILPNWDPRSHLSRWNIVKTCARCHPGSNRRFAGYLTHATHHDPDKYPILFGVFWAMTGLLLGTLSLAGLHTLAWLPRSLAYRRALKEAGVDQSRIHVQRFTPFYRKLHLTVIISFFGLALTGMTVKFSYAPWARYLAEIFGGVEGAAFIHRICALVTFVYFGLHLWDLFWRKMNRGRDWRRVLLGPNTMLPTLTDLREVVSSIKWFLNRGPRHDYGRWTY